MFQFSADQEHALQHGLQDLGKLTLAVMFLGSSLGLVPGVASHSPTSKPASYQMRPLDQPFGNHTNLSEQKPLDRLNARL